MTSIYDGEFRGNTLEVGKTGCGKTKFLEKLGIHNLFGNLVKTEWISRMDIDKIKRPKFNHVLVMRQKCM